jgi:hypothetical protein
LSDHDILSMLRFVTADGNTFSQKRKQSQRACSPCRKKKKRCDHAETRQPSTAFEQHSPKRHALTGPSAIVEGTQSLAGERIAYPKGSESFDSPVSNRAQSATSPFEVSSITASNVSTGDVATVSAHAPADARDEARSAFRNPEPLDSRFIGDLNPEGIFLAATSPTSAATTNQQDSIGVWLVDKLSNRAESNSGSLVKQAASNCFYGYSPLVQKVLLPLLV